MAHFVNPNGITNQSVLIDEEKSRALLQQLFLEKMYATTICNQ